MKLFRNKEFSIPFVIGIVAVLLASFIAFSQKTKFGILVFTLGVFLLLLFYISSHKRYKRIESFAEAINKLLHEDVPVALEDYAEGELAVLQSEIYKMTIRMRAQQRALTDDKLYLADSLADISHQIRTPLTSINLLVNFLSEPDISEERRLKLVRELYGLLSRIDWLITALLKLSKLDAGTIQFKTERLELSELIDRSVEPVLVPMELREQGIEIDASGCFTGDLSWTCEAITNIVKNCMEHMGPGGVITIWAAENPLYSEIIISDTGSGIAPEDLPHIFERFYKGSGSENTGFGIGLALARKIITAQNGTIKAENLSIKNSQSSGAKFSIRFYKSSI